MKILEDEQQSGQYKKTLETIETQEYMWFLCNLFNRTIWQQYDLVKVDYYRISVSST